MGAFEFLLAYKDSCNYAYRSMYILYGMFKLLKSEIRQIITICEAYTKLSALPCKSYM